MLNALMVDSNINKWSKGLLFVPFAKISTYHEGYIKILRKPCLTLNKKDAQHGLFCLVDKLPMLLKPNNSLKNVLILLKKF